MTIEQELRKLLPTEKWRRYATNFSSGDLRALTFVECASELESLIPALVEMVEREQERSHAESIEAATPTLARLRQREREQEMVLAEAEWWMDTESIFGDDLANHYKELQDSIAGTRQKIEAEKARQAK